MERSVVSTVTEGTVHNRRQRGTQLRACHAGRGALMPNAQAKLLKSAVACTLCSTV